MKVSILSNGKITTTQYSNVAIDGEVSALGGGGIEVETDPIFTNWETSTGSKLVSDVSTLSEEVATKASIDSVTTLNNTVSANTDAIDALEADIATKADANDVYTKPEIDATIGAKADQNVVDANTACISSLSTTITELNTCVTTLDNTVSTLSTEVNEVSDGLATKANASDVTADLATKADASSVYTKTQVDTTLESYVKTEDLPDIPEMPDLSGYATTDSVTAGLATKADKSAVDGNTACITALNESITVLGCTVATKADSTTVSSLSSTVSNLGCDVSSLMCDLANRITYSDLGFCSTGYCYNYITVHGITVDHLYSNSCCGITIPYITSRWIYYSPDSDSLDLIGPGSEVYLGYGFVNINTQTTTTIDSPRFELQYGCYNTALSINLCGTTTIEGRFESGCLSFINSCTMNCSTTVYFADCTFNLVNYDSCSGITNYRYVTHWIDANDGSGGVIPVFSKS